MRLEEQICSLELAKRLKELGVKQESYWYWVIYKKKKPEIWANSLGYYKTIDYVESHGGSTYSAFTVAELGEMLPDEIKQDVTMENKKIAKGMICDLMMSKIKNKNIVEYIGKAFVDKSEANARAKMLIYLLENKLIEGGKE